MSIILMRRSLAVLAVVASVVTTPCSLRAQVGTGTVRGTVIQSGAGRPVPDVQVYVEGTARYAITSANGSYILSNVPAGKRTVRAKLIGFAPFRRDIDVAAAATTTADISLAPTVVTLDELVVTGVPAATSKRTVGNAITTVNAAVESEKTATSSVAELLQGRAPGVTVLQSSGTVGTSGTIRIRGVGSLASSSNPVVYVDGVRIGSGPAANFRNSYESPSSMIGARETGGGQDASLLGQLNPEEIQSIEIIKGPAASTLYGADAANGVIQIITKRGRAGEQAPQWRGRTQLGQTDWALDKRSNITTCTADRIAAKQPTGGAAWPGCQGMTPGSTLSLSSLSSPGVLRSGKIGDVSLSLTGGGQGYSYFSAVNHTGEDGVVKNSEYSLNSARTNFSFYPSDKVTYAVSLSYAQGNTRFPMGDNGTNLLEAAWTFTPGKALDAGQTDGFQGGSPIAFDIYDNRLRSDRVIAGTTLNVNPTTWFLNRLTVGADINSSLANRYIAPGSLWSPNEGQMTQGAPRNNIYNVDYAGTITTGLPLKREMTSALSFGAQYINSQYRNTISQGNNFASGTLKDINLAAVHSGWSEFVDIKSLGVFGQEQVGWKDKFFLTGALRVDNSSVFGNDIKQLYYPKVSVSYVASEESFIQSLGWVNNLKLRGAWGQAGNAPDPFAAVQSFTTVVSVDAAGNRVPALAPASLGNPNVKPERGSEIEVGFDAAFWKERAGVEVTFYDKTTKDALMNVPNQPSSGFPGGTFQNVGEINNRGVELGLNATPVSNSTLSWDTRLGFSHNANKLVKFGYDQKKIVFGLTAQNQQHVEGYPLGGFWVHDPVIDPTTGNVVPSEARFLGSADPTREVSFGNTFTFLKNFRLYGLLDYKGGFFVTNQTDWRRCSAGVCPQVNDPSVSAADKKLLQADLQSNDALWTQPGDFLKLRDVSLSYDLPSYLFMRSGAERAALQIAVHNAGILWTKGYTGLDPEVNFSGTNGPTGAFGLSRVDYWTMPMTRRITVSLDVSF
ncbi:MAG: SusC/RagA family TonB-linked outer membrane protein [bacterium]